MTASPQPTRVAAPWTDETFPAARVERDARGGVIPVVTREVAEQIVAANERMIAEPGGSESDLLRFEGDTLICFSQVYEETVARIDADADGLYVLATEWLWDEA